jgi:GT2 family glycosyltransferase
MEAINQSPSKSGNDVQDERNQCEQLSAQLMRAEENRLAMVRLCAFLEKDSAQIAQDLEDMKVERAKLEAVISNLEDAKNYLAIEVSKAYRRPLRPLKYMLLSAILKALAKITKPLSTQSSKRFERSAAKRSPRRFEAFKHNNAGIKSLEHPIFNHVKWLQEFDTPDSKTLRHYYRSAPATQELLFIIDFESNDLLFLHDVANSLNASIGVVWRAVLRVEKQHLPASFLQVLAEDSRFSTIDEATLAEDAIIIYVSSAAELRSHGARLLVDAVLAQPNAAVAYCDEDTMSSDGKLHDPWFKPVFSPLLARQGLLLGRVVALKPSDAVERQKLYAAFLQTKTDMRQVLIDYALKAGAGRVISVPHIAFHNRLSPPAPIALLRPALPEELPFVSVVILTRDRWDLLGQCLDSMYATDWPSDKLEIIVVDNGSTETACIDGLKAAAAAGKIVLRRDDGQFNFSRLNNEAVACARGDLIVLLNNDTRATTPDWLKEMATYALLPNAGLVGPKLLYDDSTVQHAGVICGIQGVAAHAHLRLEEHEGGYQNLANVTREILAVTGACIAVQKSKYLEVGGMNEQFRVAFGDTVLCLDLFARGYTNYYVHKALFFHYESKTRGYDDTVAKRELARSESIDAWKIHKPLLQEDPYYSPNLSLEEVYEPAFAPRRRLVWKAYDGRPLHVLILSCVHKKGHGVPVVIAQHARGLIERGYRVTLGGPLSDLDFEYAGCRRLDVEDPRLAARWAAMHDVDVIIAHTPPFYSVARWTGRAIPVVAYDHGEPPPERFDDEIERRMVLREKDFCLHMCAKVFAISEAIRAESRTLVDGVIRLGNTHLCQWDESKKVARDRVRATNGWTESFVVLNVTRFHIAEQRYKGVDIYIETLKALRADHPAKSVVFVLCGKGNDSEILELQRNGLDVRANVSDDELEAFYAAADAYANFSQWEGYNLGVGQALAMGLPVVASDIPAHRAFGVKTVPSSAAAAKALAALIASSPHGRKPELWRWDEPLDIWDNELSSLCEKWFGRDLRDGTE